jgi:phage protein D
MSVVTLPQESARQEGFYVPRFQVKIDGANLPHNVLRDVTQLTYKDDIKTIDNFELTVNNWDPTINKFKYVGSETAQDLQGGTPDSQRYKLFEPCSKKVEVWLGYAGTLQKMLTGNFTTMEPNFTSGAASTLTVRGLNVLHQLRRKQYTYSWTDKKDSEIAKNVNALKDEGKPRFPLHIEINPNALGKETPIDFVSQNNQYDIDFLFTRARQRGYVVFIQEPTSSGGQQTLYFGPSDGTPVPALRDVTFDLEWGKSLLEFKPTLTTANQVRSVTVNGWNRATKQRISAKVDLNDKEISRNKDLYRLLEVCDPREEVVVDEPVFTVQQARKRAITILNDRQKEMVKFSATTIGLPDLRAGQKVRISGLGARFNGLYFITDTTHTINESGYITRFNGRREDDRGRRAQ